MSKRIEIVLDEDTSLDVLCFLKAAQRLYELSLEQKNDKKEKTKLDEISISAMKENIEKVIKTYKCLYTQITRERCKI